MKTQFFKLLLITMTISLASCKKENKVVFTDFKYADKPDAMTCGDMDTKLLKEALYSFEDDIVNHYDSQNKNTSRAYTRLITESTINRLKIEEYEFWSLGAVPFTVYDDKLLTMEGMINFIGRRLRFAYNYKGLYYFKNKFSPTWIEYYFCIKPKLTFYVLIKVLIKTNLHKLIINKLPVILPFRIINKGY